MATFEVRVEGMTGLSIDGSSSPTQDELTEYLKDGVIDVTERVLMLRPQDSANFTARSATQSTNGADFNGTKIVGVIREAGADGDTDGSTAWRECRRIPPQNQSRATDSTSLEYATKYNPVYTLDDSGKVYVYPTPDGSDDGYQVYYINNTPQNSSGTALVYSHSDLKHFPQDKYYLVVLYAACQSLLNNLSSYSISESVPSLTLPETPVPPDAPNFSNPTIRDVIIDTMPDIDATTISNIGTPPTYTSPTVTLSTGELTTLTVLDSENTLDDFDGNAIHFDKWFATAAHLIEDEEDVELANAQLQKIQTYIQTYSAQVQDNLNDFQKEQAEYQAKTQEAIQQAQIDAAKAQAQAQIDASKVTTQAQLDSADAQQEAALLLQKENQEYAAKLQQFSSDLGKYSAEVQAKVQDHTAQIAQISAEIQKDSTEYNWISQRYAALKGQYDQAFGLMAPKEGQD